MLSSTEISLDIVNEKLQRNLREVFEEELVEGLIDKENIKSSLEEIKTLNRFQPLCSNKMQENKHKVLKLKYLWNRNQM